ncbi:MAG: PKD domain-containing protein [Hymenobacter sp.]|nr:MAG: PKD domain-containing protein [Hymenobacter sp.]
MPLIITWLGGCIVHGWQSNALYSFLLSPSGISTTPVISNVGSVHQGGGSFFGAGNAIGCMKASPDGRRLALAERDNLTELFDFNNATGGVSNYISLGQWSYNYGVEFSPDNSRLYVSLVLDGQVLQFNLLAGSPSAIQSSGRVVGYGARSGTLQRGPDNKIYLAIFNAPYLDVINNPNALGNACNYQTNAVSLAGKLSQNGLPNMPNAFGVNDRPTATAAFTAAPSCAGAAVAFTGTTTPTVSTAVASWNFGDPTSGSANTATGLTATHTYTAAGTYQVTLTVTDASLAAPATSTQSVTVAPLPSVRLGGDTLVCPNAVWTLRPSAQPAGTLYRWQDGSTGATYVAHGPGQYSVEVRATAAGCPATATLSAGPKDCPILIPNIITPNGDPQNEFFVLKGLTPSDWSLRIFDRWGRQVYNQAKYDNGWNAPGQAPGLYYYLLSNLATGERHQGWVEVVRGS